MVRSPKFIGGVAEVAAGNAPYKIGDRTVKLAYGDLTTIISLSLLRNFEIIDKYTALKHFPSSKPIAI